MFRCQSIKAQGRKRAETVGDRGAASVAIIDVGEASAGDGGKRNVIRIPQLGNSTDTFAATERMQERPSSGDENTPTTGALSGNVSGTASASTSTRGRGGGRGRGKRAVSESARGKRPMPPPAPFIDDTDIEEDAINFLSAVRQVLDDRSHENFMDVMTAFMTGMCARNCGRLQPCALQKWSHNQPCHARKPLR